MPDFLNREKTKDGNRMFFLLALAMGCFIMHSCSTAKKTAQQPPVKPDVLVVKEEKPVEPKAEVVKPVNITLLLSLDLKNQVKMSTDTSEENTIDASVLPNLQFLEGATLAADSIRAMGIELHLKTLDAPTDSVAFTNMLYRKEAMQADALFASLAPNLAPAAVNITKKHNNKIVFTQPVSSSVLKQNKQAYLAVPSTASQCEEAADFIFMKYPSAKIMVISRDVKREKDIADIFRKKLGAKADFVLYTTQLFDSLSASLSKTAQNVIILTSSDQDFISPLLNKINALNMANITVMGLPTWENFESIDYGNLKNLKIWYFTSMFTDASNMGVQRFRQIFYNKFKTEPTYNAYQGFDLVMAFTKQLSTNKKAGSIVTQLVPYRFTEFGDGNGYENKLIYILEIEDYELIKLN